MVIVEVAEHDQLRLDRDPMRGYGEFPIGVPGGDEQRDCDDDAIPPGHGPTQITRTACENTCEGALIDGNGPVPFLRPDRLQNRGVRPSEHEYRLWGGT